MSDIDSDDPLLLTGADFYRAINAQYGTCVEKILRFFDVDNYSLLNGVREHHIFDVLEKPNDINTSDEALTLKKEICCFVGEKVLLKVGTKGKISFLLKTAHELLKRRKKLRSSSSGSSNYGHSSHSKSESYATTNNDSNEHSTMLEEHRNIIEEDLKKLLGNVNSCVHGVTHDNITFRDFQIIMKKNRDNDQPICWIKCICGHEIKLYFKDKKFQVSNISNIKIKSKPSRNHRITVI